MSEQLSYREKFARDLAEVEWQHLRIHLQRDVIILVAEELDLIEVAVAVAKDDKDQVALWIAAGKLCKPSREQIDQWEGQLEKPFRMLIAQPYILAQTVSHA